MVLYYKNADLSNTFSGFQKSYSEVLRTMVMGIIQFSMPLLGGKLADSRNRKHIIVVCDLVSAVFYIIVGLKCRGKIGFAVEAVNPTKEKNGGSRILPFPPLHP